MSKELTAFPRIPKAYTGTSDEAVKLINRLMNEREDALAKVNDLAEQLGRATLAAGMSDNLPQADTLAKTIEAADALVRTLSEHCEPQVIQAAMAEALASVEPIDFGDSLMGPEAHPGQTASAVFGGDDA